MTSIRTFLWFNTEAEEAANYYVSVFDDGEITGVTHFGSAGPGAAGTVQEVSFELAGREFVGLNGGPDYEFNESVSILVTCDTQDEVDHYWSQLTSEGEEGPCGWLKDRYGLSWQVFPNLFFELRADPEATKSQAVMAAMLQMGKVDSAGLQSAYDNA